MRRRTIHFVAFALPALLVLNGVGFAAGSPKKPWQWTAEERAAVLRDSTARTERVRAYEQKGRAARVRVGGSAVAADVIDGNEHPELYFPTQLFEHMVRVAFAMPPGAYPTSSCNARPISSATKPTGIASSRSRHRTHRC